MSRKIWTKEEILEVYNKPLMQLLYDAATVHRQNFDPLEVQMSTLLSIKTGGCSEDCGYCPQAARYNTGVDAEKMMEVCEVIDAAKTAKANGSSRLCMGAAWRNVRDNRDFDQVLDMVRKVNEEGLEVCATLGMLTESQAQKLEKAGLYAYNHNLDTSADYYDKIISTRNYDDRMNTLENVRKTKISLCSGGIIGLGETTEDRIGMLLSLQSVSKAPESIPINALVAVEGTPLEDQKPVEIWEMVRMIATTRIVFPSTVVRLSAGRTQMADEGQAMCFMAGANSIFAGDKLLTTPNPEFNEDQKLFETLGLKKKAPYQDGEKPEIQSDVELDGRLEKEGIRKEKLEAARANSAEKVKSGEFEPRKFTNA